MSRANEGDYNDPKRPVQLRGSSVKPVCSVLVSGVVRISLRPSLTAKILSSRRGTLCRKSLKYLIPVGKSAAAPGR